jgi:carbon-monoxide dehydrogenase medium subunit|tara:strand:- start:634 stop:1506 length:873 start_codon:yes stop_codon:yes gene_type:complete
MTLPAFEYRAPSTIEEVIALRRELGDDALVMNGGLMVVNLLRERLTDPHTVLSLSNIPELQLIEADNSLHIGATVSYRDIEKSEVVRTISPLLSEACVRVGSPAIRNMGTLGGNVCYSDGASDSAPALLALGAEAVVRGSNGDRRIPLSEFFFGLFRTAMNDDEILTQISIPRPVDGTQTRYTKFTSTSAEAYSTVTVATSLVIDSAGQCIDARIGLGSVAPFPMRARAAEDILRGQPLTGKLIAETADAAMAETDPSSSPQGSADYRREMTGVWVRRLLEDMLPERSRA